MRPQLEEGSSVDAGPSGESPGGVGRCTERTNGEPQLRSGDAHTYVRASCSEEVVAAMLSHGYSESSGEVNVVLPEATSFATGTPRRR
jgi:hypothetical protein